MARVTLINKKCEGCNNNFSTVIPKSRFCSISCSLTGDRNGKWRGGRIKNDKGYILIHSPLHPYKNSKNHVLEHRLVMEKHLGRYLKKDEVVHHKNKNPSDNRLRNLELMNKRDHSFMHAKEYFTPEIRKKLSYKSKEDFRTGKRKYVDHWTGRKHTEETKEKIRQAKLKKNENSNRQS